MRSTVEIESETAIEPTEAPAPRGLGRSLLACAVSGAALAALVYAYVVFPGAAAEPESPVESEGIALASDARPLETSLPGTSADAPIAAPAAAEAAVSPPPPSELAPPVAPTATTAPGAVAVPDFASLRVPAARRRARTLGLRLVVRDPYGQAIDLYDAPRYVVRRQRTEPGAQVPTGSTVRLVAEDPTPPVMGY
ncbi:MAG: hypothetical protein U0234_32485 [Sandaracinus sp.]